MAPNLITTDLDSDQHSLKFTNLWNLAEITCWAFKLNLCDPFKRWVSKVFHRSGWKVALFRKLNISITLYKFIIWSARSFGLFKLFDQQMFGQDSFGLILIERASMRRSYELTWYQLRSFLMWHTVCHIL